MAARANIMATMRYRLLLDDIDAAGVVFGPRLLALAHHAVELRLVDTLLDFSHMLRERRWAMPLVNITADFTAPLTHGQVLSFALSVAELGERRVVLRIVVSSEHGPAATITQTHACLDLSTRRATPWPDPLRTAWTALAEQWATATP